MIGQDIQDRVDALVVDLQTKGKGQTINILFRNPNNSPNVMPLSSDAQGVVNAGQLAAVQAFINPLKGYADNADAFSQPVAAASEAFKTARGAHEPLIVAAQTANAALKTALDADAVYQAARTALDNARLDQDYVESQEFYDSNNVSENYAALAQAKGEYIAGDFVA